MRLSLAVLENNDYGRPAGAASLVSPGHLLTCIHVLRDAGYPRNPGTTIKLRVKDGTAPVTATTVDCPWIDSTTWPHDKDLPPSHDVVALKLDSPLTGPAANLRAVQLSDAGAEVYSFGFPATKPNGGEAYGRLSHWTEMRGLRQLETVPGRTPIETGFSGGPVLDSSDMMIGIVVARWRPGTQDPFAPQVGYMIEIDAISALFGKHNLAKSGVQLSVLPPVLAKYKQAQKVVQWATQCLDTSPYDRPRVTPLLPVRLAFATARLKPSDAFARIEQLHIGPDPDLTGFTELSPPEVFSMEETPNFYIQAPGGAGKTFLQCQLVITSVSAGVLPVYLGAGNTAGGLEKALGRDSTEDRLKALFEWARKDIGFTTFKKAADAGDRVLLILDGLNEVVVDARAMAEFMANVATDYASCQVVITDRMSYRTHYPDNFLLATISPVKGSETVQFPGYERLLRNAFFLDLLRESGTQTAGKRGELILRYLEKLLNTGATAAADPTIKALAEAAFRAYQDRRQEISGKSLKESNVDVDPLVSAGLLQTVRPAFAYRFRHQLIHDFLAARRHLLSGEEIDSGIFETLTFERRSADALIFLLEELDKEKADDLIVRIYDWDWGLTLSCLLQTRGDPGDALATAICAVISEKLDDTFLHTRQRPRARLSALKRFLGAEADADLVPEKVRALICNQKDRFTGSRLEAWWATFTAEKASEAVWLALTRNEPLQGWTAASTLRRIASDQDHSRELLVVLYHALNHPQAREVLSPVRWRAVHVLGRYPVSAVLMLDIGFDDAEDKDVRYGALREAVEIAAKSSEDEGREILSEANRRLRRVHLANREEEGGIRMRSLCALRNCAILRGKVTSEPAWWRDAYRPLLASATELAKSDQGEYQQWKSQQDRFEADERDLSD